MSLSRIVAFGLAASALFASIAALSCKSSSDDCAPFPTHVTYDCEPLEAGEVADGGVVCSSMDPDASQATYPSGCTATSTIPSAFNAGSDCLVAVRCDCQVLPGAASGQFYCPN